MITAIKSHVRRIRKKRQRVDDDADDDLDRHEADDQGEGDCQTLRVGIGANAVAV